ncbi:RNA polymerase, sigma 54 (sigma N) factor [Candidatus Methylobacter favarea]|uniref:RNA polymerase sigma-54 factor n=1 Tax=Candidatus Methylobacter favarea TaxID=2707345 RepID=A0A8S0WK19_9GAMM|nr:RNA polymerase factor sigma-54 [Candidatus Methylobacter favarea]CAA9891658.1 RNA polymerase, sigma 54 (sigma N) factor [Candidatus Methylobacter favarea]
MKQSLHLRLGQQVAMTPQLQQAIKLLQMSTLDLQQEIQQALESNMMLEINEEESAIQSIDAMPEKKTEHSDSITSEGSQTDIPDELPVDSSWDDVYENSVETGAHSGETVEFETQRSKSSTLLDHLLWQLELTNFSERDHAIAMAIIDSINEDGYLISAPEEIFQGLQSQLDDLYFDEVNAVLHRVQNFDPVGVAAIDLGDCLRIQLQQLPEFTPYRTEALIAVSRYLELLANHDQAKLMRRLGISERQLGEVVALIRTMDPRPGAQIQDAGSEYVIPDVYVTKQNDKWQVNLNPDIAPKLRINPIYSAMIKRADNSKDNTCMKDHLQEARWFIKSLHSRNETLLRVARSIVEKQTGFLEHGSIAMKPMVLRDIAEELELHESTISRVTTQKFMHTPNGIIEFKYFFSSHVSTEGGGECSSTAIRAFIKELVANENPARPLSDNKISDILQEKGINVARRTIAKYREAMFISSSSQRKRIL